MSESTRIAAFEQRHARRTEELFAAGKLARLIGGPEAGMYRDLGPRDGMAPAKAWIPSPDADGYYAPSASDPFVYEWHAGPFVER